MVEERGGGEGGDGGGERVGRWGGWGGWKGEGSMETVGGEVQHSKFLTLPNVTPFKFTDTNLY